MKLFDPKQLKQLYKPPDNSSGEQNGQVTIIGGSKLFHGAPIFALRAASRIVDMVFFASPEPSIGEVANKIKASLSSFIWVPWSEVEHYLPKSDAILIGPGLMRYSSETRNPKSEIRNEELDNVGKITRDLTKRLLTTFPDKKWVIDAGSLQTMETSWIPQKSIVTPNKHEFEILFGEQVPEDQEARVSLVEKMAKKFKCTIVLKSATAIVSDGAETVLVTGGNAGLTKGGTGDTLAGLTVALLAKNDSFLAAASAVFILKKTAEDLESTVGVNFNADDLADRIATTYKKLLN